MISVGLVGLGGHTLAQYSESSPGRLRGLFGLLGVKIRLVACMQGNSHLTF